MSKITGSPNGDVTESFFHLSSDHSSDHISSADDVSMHTMDDISTFLRLAKAHDMNTRRAQPNIGFPDGKSAPLAHQTPKDWGYANNSHSVLSEKVKRHAADAFADVSGHGSTFDGYDQDFKETSTLPQSILQGTRDIDVESLFRAFQPLLEQYLNSKLSATERHAQTPNAVPQNENESGNGVHDSDPDSLVDDTFDRPKRGALRAPHAELSSPVTSPPQSSGDSRFYFDKSTEVDDSDLCQQIGPQTRKERSTTAHHRGHVRDHARDHSRGRLPSADPFADQHAGNSTDQLTGQSMPHDSVQPTDKDSYHHTDYTTRNSADHHPHRPHKRSLGAPQLELGDLTADEIDLDLGPHKDDVVDQASEDSRTDALESLNLKLEQYRKDNEGLKNEIEFLKSKLDSISLSQRQVQQDEVRKDTCAAEDTQSADAEEETDSYEDNIPDQFRPYCQQLQLRKVDDLGDSEKATVIKNVMLSLLVCDFDHLSVMMPKVGAFLRMAMKFLDTLHEKLYPDQDMKPSQYLRNYNIDINGGLQQCLDGMLKLVCELLNDTLGRA
ncbi:hypothetical protein JCM33374_g2680 [Metschnikowia sp. JCM 33374]|nr:hypothetical protein JCM33374_g2680 [Metschnikowia sp. JCM 33374]